MQLSDKQKHLLTGAIGATIGMSLVIGWTEFPTAMDKWFLAWLLMPSTILAIVIGLPFGLTESPPVFNGLMVLSGTIIMAAYAVFGRWFGLLCWPIMRSEFQKWRGAAEESRRT